MSDMNNIPAPPDGSSIVPQSQGSIPPAPDGTQAVSQPSIAPSFTVPSVGLGDKKEVIAPAPTIPPKVEEAQTPSPKAGLDLGTAQAAAIGGVTGIGRLAKGAIELPGKAIAYQLAGQPNEDVEKQMEDESEALKHRVYADFKDKFRKGHYGDALASLTHLFTDAPQDPNDPLYQMIDEQFQSSKVAKERMMEAAKKGDWAATAQHAAGMVPLANDVDAAMERFRANPTRDNLKEVIANAIPAFVPSLTRGVAKGAGAAKAAILENATPTVTETTRGAQIPTLAETRTGRITAAGAPEVAEKFTQTKTAPEVSRAISGTAGEAMGSEAESALTPQDRFGFNAHGEDLQRQAQPVFQRLDKLTDDKFSQAQNKIQKGFATNDQSLIDEGRADKKAFYDQYREQLKGEGLDVDTAEANWRKGAAATDFAKALKKATGVSDIEGADWTVKGRVLRNVIDKADQIDRNGTTLFERMGLSQEHVSELKELSKVLDDQQQMAKAGPWLKNLFKLSMIAAGIHGGFGSLIEAATGASLAEHAGNSLAGGILQEAISNQEAAKALTEGLKSGNMQPVAEAMSKNQSWVDRIKDAARDMWESETGEAGLPGSVGKGTKNAATRKLPTGDELVKKYGTADDPGQAAFILADGRPVAMGPGSIHDQMLGGKATDVPAPRERFINEQGGIRIRSRGSMGQREFSLSIPKEGITPEQLARIKKWTPQMGSGRVYIETPGGASRVVDYGKASSDLENAIRDIAPIKGEEPPSSKNSAAASADEFNASKGKEPIQPVAAEAHPQGKAIADAYEAMKHEPNRPAVRASYDSLKKGIDEQWDHATSQGFKFEPWEKEGQPYKNSKEMMKDVDENKHLFFFRGGEVSADHPLAEVDPETGLTYNEKLRAVHDLYGHAATGFEFGPKGEEGAYKTHAQMFDSEAVPALTTETRGQNNWVNFGKQVRDEAGNIIKKGEKGYVPPAERAYAENKAGILPSEFHAGNAETVISHIENGHPYAAFTAENPGNARLSDAENAARNQELMSDLRQKGYRPVTVEGVMENVEGQKEHSFFVPNITPEDALELGKKYGQDSVLTNDGLHILSKNTLVPVKGFVKGAEALKEPYHSVVNGHPFAVQLDWDKEAPKSDVEPTSPNLSSPGAEGAGSAEAISRETSRQAQKLRVYDVDTRKAGAKSGWTPVFGVDTADRVASPGHAIVEVDPDGNITQEISSNNARPLPKSEQIKSLIGTEGLARPEVAAEAAYRKGLAAKEIGTRQPFSASASMENDPSALAGIDALDEADRQSPSRMTQAGKPVLGIKQKLVAALADYKNNGISGLLDAANPDAAIEKFVEHAKSNLKWLYGATPEVIRNTARQWYETAHESTKKLAQDNGISHEQSAAVTAALSPQNDWNNNVGQAQRIIEHWRNDQNHAWTSKMDNSFSDIRNGGQVSEPMRRMMDTIRGKRYNQLTAKDPDALLAKKAMWIRVLDEAHSAPDTPIYAPDGSVQGSQTLAWNSIDPMAKSLSILEDGSVDNINRVMGNGHKIRNFYNNIVNPWSERGHVTVDTHQVGASMLKPFSGDDIEVMHNFGSGNRAGTPSPAKHAGTGLRGSYPVYEEAVRRAAKELGVQPRELQSITWEGIRSLMGDVKKTPELRRAINDIWAAHEDGQITLDQAREEILKASGGFSKPNWITDEQWEQSGGQSEPGQTDFAFGANQ
ncbi:MAG: hypothetical protein C5B59_08590 [Bacteroidetes bacterium]|nr:MAG: hypothetical protein C5B59_08590 [Bacteroidota bacterium]